MAIWDVYHRFLFWTRYLGPVEAENEEELDAILHGRPYEKPKPKLKVFEKPPVLIGETLLSEVLLDSGWMIEVKKPNNKILYRYYKE